MKRLFYTIELSIRNGDKKDFVFGPKRNVMFLMKQEKPEFFTDCSGNTIKIKNEHLINLPMFEICEGLNLFAEKRKSKKVSTRIEDIMAL